MSKKKHDILVINKAYVPIHIVGWGEGISLVYKGAAHALDREFIAYDFEDWCKYPNSLDKEYAHIQTARGPIPVPEIIALIKFDRLPSRNVKFSRENLFKRDKHRCMYCGGQFPYKELTIDHIVPRSKGGTSVWSNVATSCKPCNNRKADRTLEQSGLKLLRKPVKPKWISPLASVTDKEHPCRSWLHFINRVDTHVDSFEQ